ncbi:hypothetical protein D3C87_1734120 [compost metagenome]
MAARCLAHEVIEAGAIDRIFIIRRQREAFMIGRRVTGRSDIRLQPLRARLVGAAPDQPPDGPHQIRQAMR